MYSQHDEEKYILNFFKDRKGSFLDIGAYNGKAFSNTHQLALNGWTGVCVEPSPVPLKDLRLLYKDNPGIKILPVGIGLKKGIYPFFDTNGDAISSFDGSHVKKWQSKNVPFNTLHVEVITPDELFNIVGYDFDFINIDTEGWNWQLLQKLPFNQLINLKMICVEYDNSFNEMMMFLNRNGFKLYYKNDENVIAVRNNG